MAGPKFSNYIFIRDRKEDTEMQGQRGNETSRQRMERGSFKPRTAKDCRQQPETRRKA